MRKLEPPDSHCISAVMGWLELGNAREAEVELRNVSAEVATHPDVLEARYAVLSQQQRWPEALEAAQQLTRLAPKRVSGWLHQAYALRRVPDGGLEAAWHALLPMSEIFPNNPTVPYNLSCYACQMDQLEAAWEWLERAITLAGKEAIKELALADSDLKPLWQRITAL